MVFVCMPSAKPRPDANAALQPWRDKGYKLAIFRDAGMEPVEADLQLFGEYRGYPKATNLLCRSVLNAHPEVQWLVTAGDDMLPDPNLSPEEIEFHCTEHFNGTMGVMQPTGDQLGWDGQTFAAERICGSPWLGRTFIERKDGKPFDESYWHFFADQQLREELDGTNLLWQRRDLTHHHNHWHRMGVPRPEYMKHSASVWGQDEATFYRWKATRCA